jgi:hypothetical protein
LGLPPPKTGDPQAKALQDANFKTAVFNLFSRILADFFALGIRTRPLKQPHIHIGGTLPYSATFAPILP